MCEFTLGKVIKSPNGLLVFALVTLFMLYAPRYDHIYQPVAWIIVIVSAVFCLYEVGLTNYRFYLMILSFLSFLILLSSSFHYLALSQFDSTVFITVNKDMASWGKNTAVRGASIYLLLNCSIVAGMLYLSNIDKTLKAMLIIPFLFIPSLLAGLYQGLFDVGFMNRNQISGSSPIYVMGLSYDQSSFGILLYLLFPSCVLGIISVKKVVIKTAYWLLITLVLVCLLMRGQKTTLGGIIIFTGLLPIVMLWVHGWRLRPAHFKKLIICAVFCALVFAGPMLYLQKNPGKMPLLMAQTVTTYENWKKEGLLNFYPQKTGLWKVAWILTGAAPVAGWGPGGYSRNYYNTFFEIKEPPVEFDNVGNYYLQVTSELGVTGCVLTLLLYILPVVMVAGTCGQLSAKQRWTVGILSLSTLVFLLLYLTGPHIFAPDVLWVVALYLAGLLSVRAEIPPPVASCGISNAARNEASSGECGAERFESTNRNFKLFYPIVFFFILSVAVFFCIETYQTSFGSKGYKALVQSEKWPLKNEYGYYGQENWNGAIMRWLVQESSTSVKASGDLVEFKVVAAPENSSGPEGLKLDVIINDLFTDTLHFFNGGERKLSYYIPGIKDKDVVIKTKVSETFNPKRLRINDDTRDLGIARGVIRFYGEVPKEGIGFYGWEEWGGKKPFRFRWTGGRASVPLEKTDLEQIQILCSHPDIEQNSVVVTVFVDDKPVCQKEVRDKMWKKIEFNPDSPIDGKVVTLQVSRTWNPKGMGISADGRDLGVAVR
jgi:hypothetical protein